MIVHVNDLGAPPRSSDESAAMLSRSLARLAPVGAPAARRLSTVGPAAVRNDWTREEIGAIYRLPFTELLHQAATAHRQHFDPLEVQRCTLLSIKTGGCNEDCKYCAQSTRYKTFVKPEPLMSVDAVVEAARRAKNAGSTRFCMGTAWRELGNKKGAFGKILKMVEEVNGMGLEVCCTLGMLSEEQVKRPQGRSAVLPFHKRDTSPYASPPPSLSPSRRCRPAI
jgi:biotin synthase